MVQRSKKRRIEQTLTFEERLAPILLRFEKRKQRLSGCDEQQQEELDDAVSSVVAGAPSVLCFSHRHHNNNIDHTHTREARFGFSLLV
jgi:hypothetical protein